MAYVAHLLALKVNKQKKTTFMSLQSWTTDILQYSYLSMHTLQQWLKGLNLSFQNSVELSIIPVRRVVFWIFYHKVSKVVSVVNAYLWKMLFIFFFQMRKPAVYISTVDHPSEQGT